MINEIPNSQLRGEGFNEDRFHLHEIPDSTDWVDDIDTRIDQELGVKALLKAVFEVPIEEAIP